MVFPLGRRPAATKTLSKRWASAGALGPSKVTQMPSALASTLAHLVLV